MKDQQEVLTQLNKIMEIFTASEGEIRPHFILTGPSGSGKSYTVEMLADKFDLFFVEINAAQLTKEGTSGNSLSKALGPLGQTGGRMTVCFVDEFDKLFISGNSNSHLAHETTNGVQNEFLKVLESSHASVYSDYGKYIDIAVDKTLFIFAGAFNGEENIDMDRLRSFGIKTEFLGRVGLSYNLKKLSLETMEYILKGSPILKKYLQLFPTVKEEEVVGKIMSVVKTAHEKNTLGARLITTLLNRYFINGGNLSDREIKKTTFQRTLSFSSDRAENEL